MGLCVEWIDNGAAFHSLRDQWDHLAVGDPTPFSRHAWFAAFIDAFAPSRLRTCTVWSGDRLVAALPARSTVLGLTALANDHTPALRPLAEDDASLVVLCAASIRARPTLAVRAVPAEHAALASLAHAAAEISAPYLVEPAHVSPFVDTSGGYGRYRWARRRALAEYERRRRKLEREHAVEIVTVAQPPDLWARLEEGFRLEARGWKGRRGTAILSSAQTETFYRVLVERYTETGEIRLSWLRVDGVLAAFDLALLDRGRYHLLKTAYNEDLRRWGPGMLLRLAVVERCFETAVTSHEFLGDDMPWKRVFATGKRPHVSFRRYGPGPVGRTRLGYRRHARPILKSMRDAVRGPRG